MNKVKCLLLLLLVSCSNAPLIKGFCYLQDSSRSTSAFRVDVIGNFNTYKGLNIYGDSITLVVDNSLRQVDCELFINLAK